MIPIPGYILVEPMPLKKRIITQFNVNNRDPFCVNAKCVHDSRYYKKGDIVQFKESLQRGVLANNNYFTGIELGLPEAEYWLIEDEPNAIGGIFGYFPAEFVKGVRTADKLHDMESLLVSFVLHDGINLVKMVENKARTQQKKDAVLGEKMKSTIISGATTIKPKNGVNKIDTSAIVVYNRGGYVIKGNLKGTSVFLARYVDQLVTIGKHNYVVITEKDIVATIV